MDYDIIIIGGGIGGLNSALKLSKKHKILLLDERNYWGGRIYTKKTPHYEAGAGRFNNKHKLLNQLIKKYNLKSNVISSSHDYLDKDGTLTKNVNIYLDTYFTSLIQKSKKIKTNDLKTMTLYEFMNSCNSVEISDQVVNMFGYYSEIKEMNAYDALNTFSNDFIKVQYYYLSNGLSQLCNKMVEEIKENGGICKNNSLVKKVTKNKLFEVETNDGNYKSEKIIFAIKGIQLKQFHILQPIHKYIKSLYNAPLLRIYAKYPVRKNGVWFNNLQRTTTNSILRQIIPIDYETGLIMISYSDGKDINSFKDKNGKLLDETKILNLVEKELDRLFYKVPKAIYFKIHYWNIGAHHWKPCYDSEFIHNKVLNPIDNVYVCGECFSHKQAWMEGALETSEKVIYKIL